jgi:hypothetical protein
LRALYRFRDHSPKRWSDSGKVHTNHPKVGGRPKGGLNKSTLEGRAFAQQLVNDPEYRTTLRERLLAGKLPPGVESMLWFYAIGKPKEEVELSTSVGTRDVASMSDDELVAELEAHHRATAAFLASQHHQPPPHSQGD